MNLLNKPCGCFGFSLFVRDFNTLTKRRMYVEDDEFNSSLGTGNLSECGTCVTGNFPSYTSTDAIELQEEKDKIKEENWETTKTTTYLLYGCLKCGEIWREKYKQRTNRNCKGEK